MHPDSAMVDAPSEFPPTKSAKTVLRVGVGWTSEALSTGTIYQVAATSLNPGPSKAKNQPLPQDGTGQFRFPHQG